MLNTVAYLLFSVYCAFVATLLFIDFFSQWCLLLVFMSDFNNSMQKSLNTAFYFISFKKIVMNVKLLDWDW